VYRFRDWFDRAIEGQSGLSLFSHNTIPQDGAARRNFALQPIVARDRCIFGYKAMVRPGWEAAFCGDPDTAARMMVDNWLLYGFGEGRGSKTIVLDCTRDTLVSGILSLLPRTAVFEIQKQIEPDGEVLSACRSLKAAGYRIAVPDIESLDRQGPFLEMADAAKVDLRLPGWKNRVHFLERFKNRGVALIAEHIHSEDVFSQAIDAGFELFQGDHLGPPAFYSKPGDSIDSSMCLNLLEQLHLSGFRPEEFLDAIEGQPGLECRLLRVANWSVPPNAVLNSTRDALAAVGRMPLYRLVTLAMTVTSARA
jgi:c-di-GMP-related signal transduction protein